MAKYRWGVDESFTANADLSAKQYFCLVTGSTVGEVAVTTIQGCSIIGILQNDTKIGEEATVRVLGFSKAIGNGNAFALTVGCMIRAASNGMVEGASGSMCASAFQIGTAMQALASGSNVEVEVFFTPFGFRT